MKLINENLILLDMNLQSKDDDYFALRIHWRIISGCDKHNI